MTSALIIGSFTGCGSSGSGSGGGSGLKLLYTTNTLDDYRTLLQNAIKDTASAEGVTLDVEEPATSVDEQIAQIKKAVEGGYDAVICMPVDVSTALQLEVVAKDLPMIFVNSMPTADHLEKDKHMYVGSREGDAGRFQAEYVWNKLGKPSSLNIVLFQGEPGHSASTGRSQAVHDFFKENGVNANFVFEDTAYWSDTIAAERFEIFLKTHQDFDAVFCNNDTMALGVCEAMKKHGFDLSKIPVVGVDATEAGCQSIANGDMQFTAYQSAKGQGEMSIKTAIAICKKGTAKDVEGITEDGTTVWVPFEPVDSSNVSSYQ